MPSEFEHNENGSAEIFDLDELIAEYKDEPEQPVSDADLISASPADGTATVEKKEEKVTISGELYNWAQDLVGCLIFVVLIFIFVIRIIGVDGSSMNPTLEDQDMMALLSNVFYTPKAGDIVVVKKWEFSDQPIVKRVIATEGQIVDIDFDSGEVYVDGILQDEPFINDVTHRSGDVQYPVTIPDGCIFVMGDNRNNSTDSRWSAIGMVDERCVLGKVLMVVFPFNHFGRVS